MKRLLIPAAIAVYAAGGIFTFGLVFNRIECEPRREYMCATDLKAAGALIAAMVWPLSLSAIAQETTGDKS